MDAQNIIDELRKSSYQFTTAGKLRSEIKSLSQEDQDDIVFAIKQKMHDMGNQDIFKFLAEVISEYTKKPDTTRAS
jgi:hypothetical protein